MAAVLLWPWTIFLLFIAGLCYSKCPDICKCDVLKTRKIVTCNHGGMMQIPITEMDRDIQVLIVTASRDIPNNLTIGRIFLNFFSLEEIHITHSNVPAIGDSSFWPGNNLRILNLSHNNITQLHDTDFNGLKNLQVLDLSNNLISAFPSAPFHFLSNLKTLSLARNSLRRLVPRFFYMLGNLERLDLSGNPLRNVDPENLKDLRPIKSLSLAKCQIERLHSLIYQQLPNLVELDLRDNSFNYFAPEEFRHLKKLRKLYLDGNNLNVIVDMAFSGQIFDYLGLSRNNIVSFDVCAFCNSSIRALNVSDNQFSTLMIDTLKPIIFTLQTLDIGFNKITMENIMEVLEPLHRLRGVSLSGMKLTTLPPSIFVSNRDLRYLDLSQNHFNSLSFKVLRPMSKLEVLDLSGNRFQGLTQEELDHLSLLLNLKRIVLHSNPWACNECHILPLFHWIAETTNKAKVCKNYHDCIVCDSPRILAGKELPALRSRDIPPCGGPFSQFRILTAGSRLGIIVATAVFIIILLVGVIYLVLYRRHRAVYYTHEEERCDDYVVYESALEADLIGGYNDEKHLGFVATIDTGDSATEEKNKSRNNIT
ncbi:leucine-rich repeats and immunoglobulin-like domains protein sma-10 [Limulus polyphemus]|uniref:Leucine-rich repeats and immunoglobulin-like domains protein sma-10 n=1 Tax=Limulus polyphemus TaxID=6850 RepID=A0ABM1S264_LIMPO|nr:leucine-rich repeats and immunoglobulin-like domains protein sma-10 [Limulus polyphemus]